MDGHGGGVRIYDPTPDLSDPDYPRSADGFTPLCPDCLTPFPNWDADWWVCVCGCRWLSRER